MGFEFVLKDESEEAKKALQRDMNTALDELGRYLRDRIQYNMLYRYHEPHGPDHHTEIVDTGRLFDSMKWSVDPLSAANPDKATLAVGADMTAKNEHGHYYAADVHEGTSRLHGRPYIRDTFNDEKKFMSEILKDAMR